MCYQRHQGIYICIYIYMYQTSDLAFMSARKTPFLFNWYSEEINIFHYSQEREKKYIFQCQSIRIRKGVVLQDN